MTSLLTLNKLGYALSKGESLWLGSESGQSDLPLNQFSMNELVQKITKGKDDSLDLFGTELRLEFKGSDIVTLSWTAHVIGLQSVTFNDVDLVQLIDVEKVRDLVLARSKSSTGR